MSSILDITYDDAMVITPSDSVKLTNLAGVYVGGAGSVRLTTVRGNTVVFAGVPAGTFLRIATTQIWATGTTATNMLGLTALPYKIQNTGTT